MLPILYDAKAKEFNNNGIGILRDAISCEVPEERNGLFEAELVYPADGFLFSEIKGQSIIKIKANNVQEPQLFRVYKIGKPIDGIVTFNLEHISYKNKDNFIEKMKYVGTVESILNNLNTYATNHVDFKFECNYLGTFSVDYKIRSVLNAIMGENEQGNILSLVPDGFIERDNFTIRIKNKPTNNNVLIAYGKNMTGFECEEDWSESYNMIYPYVTVEETVDNNKVENTITIPNKYIKSKYSDRFANNRILPLDCKDMFEEGEQITPTTLEAKVVNYFDTSNVDKPRLTYDINIIELANTEQYKSLGLTETIGLNHQLIVRNNLYNIDTTITVIKTVYDSLLEEYKEISLGEIQSDLKDDFTNIENKVNNAMDTINKVDANLRNDYTSYLNSLHELIRMNKSDKKDTYIADAQVEYYLSISSNTLLGGTWTETAPHWETGKYMWSRLKIIHDDGKEKYFNEAPLQKRNMGKGIKFTDNEGNVKYLHCCFSSSPIPKVVTDYTDNDRDYIGLYIDTMENDSETIVDYCQWSVIANNTNNHVGRRVWDKDHNSYYVHIKFSDDNGLSFTEEYNVDYKRKEYPYKIHPDRVLPSGTVLHHKHSQEEKDAWDAQQERLEREFRENEIGETLGKYIGLYIGYEPNENDSKETTDYQWLEIKETEISSIIPQYALSSKIEICDGEYSNDNFIDFKNKFLFYRNKLIYHDNSVSYSKEYGDYSIEYAEDRIKLVDDEIAKLKNLVTLWDGSERIAKEFDDTKKKLKEVAAYGLYEQLTIDRLNKLCDNISDCIYGSIKGYVTQAIMQNAISEVTNAITGADGGYVRLNPPNNPSEILLLDNEDINEAKTVWRFNKGGIGVSNTGYNGEYLGLTKDGKLVINSATANQIDANFIKTQVIENISTGNNYFSITANGARFGDLSTGDYTEVSKNGIKQFIKGNAQTEDMEYLRVAQMVRLRGKTKYIEYPLSNGQKYDWYTYKTDMPALENSKRIQELYFPFPDNIKKLLNGKKPGIVFVNEVYYYDYNHGTESSWDENGGKFNAIFYSQWHRNDNYSYSNKNRIKSFDANGITFYDGSTRLKYTQRDALKNGGTSSSYYETKYRPEANYVGADVEFEIMIIG